MAEDFFANIPEAEVFLGRLQQILGGELRDGKFSCSIEFKGNTPEEAKAARAKVLGIQQELRLLKKEVRSTIQALNAAWASFSASFGSKTAAQRALLREKQLEVRKNYDEIMTAIDSVLLQLDSGKRSLG